MYKQHSSALPFSMHPAQMGSKKGQNKTAGLALPTVLLWKLEMMKSLAVNY